MVVGNRNHSIDLLKFFAAILITNSHMGVLYPAPYTLMATGGAIGDALFFFCSGYLLMMGRGGDFFNWYKRRINRIFPTIFAVAIIEIVLGISNPTLSHVILFGGGWFIQAIFVFYAIFWFVKSFVSEKLWIVYSACIVIVITWFVLFWDKDLFVLSDGTYLRWPIFFMFMLMGASTYRIEQSRIEDRDHQKWYYVLAFVISLVIYYGYLFIQRQSQILSDLQIVLVLFLMIVVYSMYKICTIKSIISFYTKRYVYWPVYYISACCLEIYLSGRMSFWIGEETITLFPLNIIVTFFMICVVAYVVKVFSNFIKQTCNDDSYNWMKIVKL